MKKLMKTVLGLVCCLVFFVSCNGVGSGDATNTAGDSSTEAEPGEVDIGGSTMSYDLSDAVAILKSSTAVAQPSTSKSANVTTNLLKLTTGGEVEAVFAGDISIEAENIYVSPDGKLYMSLSSSIEIDGETCILLRLGKDNSMECIDTDLSFIDEYSGCDSTFQFDEIGNVYYSGDSSDGNTVLRKYNPETGETTNLINDNISLNHFYVKDNGTVYLAGSTSTSVSFLRELTIEGSLDTLLSGSFVYSLYELPDENVYFGGYIESTSEVLKITDEGISDDAFISYGDDYDSGRSVWACSGNTTFCTTDNDYNSCSEENLGKHSGFCSFQGTQLSYCYRSPADDFFVVANKGDYASLWQYWPEVMPVDTSIYRPTIVQGTLTTLIIAGYDESNVNKLISYNTSDASEIDFLNGENIEIYHFNYSSDTGLIIFDGLRFSDNTYIVGSIDTENGNEMTVYDTDVQYDDVQFFN